MAKKIARKPDSLDANGVEDIYSLSGCISEYFADYIKHWRHNAFWLLNAPQDIEVIARAESVSLADIKFFYYEMYEQEFDNVQWHIIQPSSTFETNVIVPHSKRLEGYDVVTFSMGNAPECSPLSCNGIAKWVNVNSHCLLKSFEEAKELIESGKLDNSEPGPFRIFAVYALPSITQV